MRNVAALLTMGMWLGSSALATTGCAETNGGGFGQSPSGSGGKAGGTGKGGAKSDGGTGNTGGTSNPGGTHSGGTHSGGTHSGGTTPGGTTGDWCEPDLCPNDAGQGSPCCETGEGPCGYDKGDGEGCKPPPPPE